MEKAGIESRSAALGAHTLPIGQRGSQEVKQQRNKQIIMRNICGGPGTHLWKGDSGLMNQVFCAISDSEINGLSIPDVRQAMGLAYRIARSAIYSLEHLKLIKSTLRARGQQRVNV